MKLSRKYFFFGALSLSASLFPNKREEPVIIIGAGASGLYAAKLLADKGIPFLILEANSRIGGRILSLNGISDFPIELGAEEIHGENSLYYKLAKKMRASVFHNDGEVLLFHKNKLIEESDAEEIVGYNKMSSMIQNLSSYDEEEKTALEYFQKEQNQFLYIAEALVGNEHGTNLSRIGMKALSKYNLNWESGEKNYLLKSRSHLSLIEEICRSVSTRIQLNSKVVEINLDSNSVLVKTESGKEITGTAVILTIPISILKRNKIKFNPSMPNNYRDAIAKIGMGSGMKIILKFENRFWDKDTTSIITPGIIPEFIVSGRKKGSENKILTGFLCGENSEKIQRPVETAISELDKIFGGKNASKNLEDSFVQDWSKEEFIGGTYSYPSLDEENSREKLAVPIEGKIFFAGEAIAGIHYGTIQGALESAVLAVKNFK
ncbi:MAG: NAD(P)/FAD-dependent oxidoreductase [Leptospiraceae bacterium]|nr:NAD(P)/FAD-dependent oxidoreductase [Leptospiraceae bacterium]